MELNAKIVRSSHSPTSVRTIKPPIPSKAIPIYRYLHQEGRICILIGSMSWNARIDITSRKANNTLAFPRRNLYSCTRSTKDTCYKSLVRLARYVSTVWASHTKSNIKSLETVQRRAAKFVSGNYRRKASVGAMLQSLGWQTLQQTQRQAGGSGDDAGASEAFRYWGLEC